MKATTAIHACSMPMGHATQPGCSSAVTLVLCQSAIIGVMKLSVSATQTLQTCRIPILFFRVGNDYSREAKIRNRRTKDKGQGTEDKETRSRLRLQPSHKAVSPTQGLKAHHSKTTRLPHKLKRAQKQRSFEPTTGHQGPKGKSTKRTLKGQREAKRD